MVPVKCTQLLEEKILRARQPELPMGEMKWTKVSLAKLAAYRRVIETIMLPPLGPLRSVEFHSLVVDTWKLKDKVFNSGSREIGFNKEIYQLCRKFGRLNRTAIFHVYLDQRSTKSSTQELRDILNHGIRKLHPERDWPYRRVHFRDSAATPCLQLLDIMLGAVAFRLNEHDRVPGASKAKCLLSERILSLANIRDAKQGTSVCGRFTIWRRKLK